MTKKMANISIDHFTPCGDKNFEDSYTLRFTGHFQICQKNKRSTKRFSAKAGNGISG